MPKRDLDCLIFHLFEKYKLIEGNSNRQKTYNLNISETKIKSYIIDSNAKYGKINQEENPVIKADFV